MEGEGCSKLPVYIHKGDYQLTRLNGVRIQRMQMGRWGGTLNLLLQQSCILRFLWDINQRLTLASVMLSSFAGL